MRSILAVALLASGAAHAQFQNRHLGIELSPMRFTDAEVTTGLMAVLDGAYYLDNGFEIGLRVPLAMFLTTTASKQLLGTGGQAYVRYLFLQESLRPWVGLELDVLYLFRDNPDRSTNTQIFAGPGASVGLEYFVTNEISIGARTFAALYFGINSSSIFRPSYGGTLNASVYF
jgi:outer membrane protein